MIAALYWWRATRRNSWRVALTVALLGGLLGAVALGALAGARRTDSAYGRYLTSINVSDAFVNVPGIVPGMPVTRPITLISRLRGISASSAYLGLAAYPVVNGRVNHGFQDGDLTGSFEAPGIAAAFLQQDRVSILAGRAPSVRSTDQIVITPAVARLFGVGVGGRVTYEFYRLNPATYKPRPAGRRSYTVAAIADVPPVLADQSDQVQTGILPPAATAQVLTSYNFAWVGLRLDHGTAGIPALQHELAGLAALAPLVRVGQSLGEVLSRSGPDLRVPVALGASPRQAALAAILPGAAAV